MTLGFPKPDFHKAPTKAEKGVLREQVWIDQGGRCKRCRRPVLLHGDLFQRMHLSHKRGGIHRSNWSRENVEGLCNDCHMVGVHNPKPCPPRPISGPQPCVLCNADPCHCRIALQGEE